MSTNCSVWLGRIENISLNFIRDHAEGIIKSSPIGYIKGAELRGSLFNDPKAAVGGTDNDGTVSCVDTAFFVDHTEPLEALARVRERGIDWPLGELREGCEFLLVFDRGRRGEI